VNGLKVDEALKEARRETAQEATVLWRKEVLPAVIDVVERLKELQKTYIKLRGAAGGGLKLDFPVFRIPELWLKKRLQKRDNS
jgi:hypothetical protein